MNKFMRLATITLLSLVAAQSTCWDTHQNNGRHTGLSVRIDDQELPESNLIAGNWETALDVQLEVAALYNVPPCDISDRIKVYRGNKLLHETDIV